MKKKESETLYPYVLDHKPGFFLTWVLYKLFQKVRFDESVKTDLKMMQKQGTVVYAIKYRGLLDYLLYHYNFRRNRIPFPKLAFDLNLSWLLPLTGILKVAWSQLKYFFRHAELPSPYRTGFYKQAIRQGTTSLIFLIDPKGFLRRFIHSEKDRLQFLLETQKEIDRPIYIVPQLVLYQKAPEKEKNDIGDILFGFKDNPGSVRKTVLFFKNHRQAFIDFAQPLDLKAYMEKQSPEKSLHDMASEIRKMLIESIDRQKRVVLGPIMKSREQLMEAVLTDHRVNEKILKLSAGDKKKHLQMRRKTREYFDEIAADYNISYIQMLYLLLTWFWKKIFEGVDVDPGGMARVRDWARKGTLIYIPSHKSHIDYLVLNYLLYQHHMHTPRIAAGKNLSFWPMGHIFRKCGAFFIRRTFRGARLYLEVFNSYIKFLLEEGHPIEFFIEGGRSRNGKLVLPKTGFLSVLLRAYYEGHCEDLIFVPASIVYDRIPEERSYLKEIGGGAKEKESFWQMLKARSLLKAKYGKVYVRFHEPFSLREYLEGAGEDKKEIPSRLAFHLIDTINRVTLVTPLSLTATAILANHRGGFQSSWLVETVENLRRFLEREGVPMADSLGRSTPDAVRDTLSLLLGWKVADCLEPEEGEETFYYVDDEKKVELEYYKNSIIHFFMPQSFAAVSLLTNKEEVITLKDLVKDYLYMKGLFVNEFFFPEHVPEEKLESVLKYFREEDLVIPARDGEGYLVTKLGFDRLPLFASLTKTFLESYWIAAKSLSRHKRTGKKAGDPLKAMDYLGRRFYKLGLVEHVESLSRVNFKNALGYINAQIPGSGKGGGAAGLQELSALADRLYELSHYRT